MIKLLNSIPESITAPFREIAKHHAIIVTLTMLGVLIYSVYTVNNILTQPADEQYRIEQQKNRVKTDFKEDTIDKLDRLKNRQEINPLALPQGRLNPFSE